jgi:histidinol-phosphate aminotransferase
MPSAAYSIGPPPAAGVRRLHLNEFRFQHSEGVVKAARAQTETPVDALLTQYQSGVSSALYEELVRYVSAKSVENILIASGSDEVLRAVLETSRWRGHTTLLMGVPGYTHFEHHARMQGLTIVAYSIGLGTSAEDHEASLRYYSGLLSEGCLVYLCSPNNPTGDLWGRARVESLAKAFPRSLFLIDEAYVEFASAARSLDEDWELPEDAGWNAEWAAHASALNRASLAPLAATQDNVVVTRTFSKAFGLAALRIGYAVGTPKTIASLSIAVSPKSFNPLAAPVALAVLEDLEHYHFATRSALTEARRVVEALKAKGWWVLNTPGNFYLVYVGDTRACVPRLTALGIQVRDRDDLPGLAGFVRITAGTSADSDAVIAAFGALQPPASPPPQTLYTSKGVVAQVKTLMKKALSILQQGAIPVWAQGGTMLGMFRHRTSLIDGGMIPWDDDGDLAYLRPGGVPDPLVSLIPRFAAAGLTLQRNRTDAYWQVGTNRAGEKISPVHIDIFSYREGPVAPDGQTTYLLEDERFRREEPNSARAECNTSYSHDELFPLSYEFRFYDLVVAMPAQSERVLRRALGENFMTEAKVRTPDGASHVSFALRDATSA